MSANPSRYVQAVASTSQIGDAHSERHISQLSPQVMEGMIRALLGYDEGVMDNISVSMYDIFRVFLKTPTPQNILEMNECFHIYTMTFNYLRELAETDVISEDIFGWELHQWAAHYALNRDVFVGMTARMQSILFINALILALVLPSIWGPSEMPEDWQRDLILCFNYFAAMFLTISIIIGSGYLNATTNASLHLEKFVVQMNHSRSNSITQILSLLSVFQIIMSSTFSYCAHLEISLAWTAPLVLIFGSIAAHYLFSMHNFGLDFQNERNYIFCETVLDEDSLLIKQVWFDSLKYLVDIDNKMMGGMGIPVTPRKDRFESFDESGGYQSSELLNPRSLVQNYNL